MVQNDFPGRDEEQRLALLAHGFKDPLNNLQTVLQMLEEGVRKDCAKKYPADYQPLFAVGQHSVYRVLRLAGNLVDADRLAAGCLTPNLENLDLAAQAERCVTQAAAYAALRGVKMTFTCEAERPFPVLCDARLMDRALLNLLSNALRHVPAAGGAVRVTLHRRQGDALLTVEDNGGGISAEAMPHLYEKYWHGRENEADSVYSTGLGLYIVRELLRLHGGDVSACNTRSGAAFTLSLPRMSGAAAERLAGQGTGYQADQQASAVRVELCDFL